MRAKNQKYKTKYSQKSLKADCYLSRNANANKNKIMNQAAVLLAKIKAEKKK